jgi:hypothetical protein
MQQSNAILACPQRLRVDLGLIDAEHSQRRGDSNYSWLGSQTSNLLHHGGGLV